MRKTLLLSIALLLMGLHSFAQWESVSPLLIGNTLTSIFFTDAKTGYLVGDYGTILKSDDGGTTWSKHSSGTTQNLRSVSFTDLKTGYAIGDHGTILKTSDYGTTWDILNSKTIYNLTSFCFPDASTGYAVGDYGTIIKTMDAGTTWETIFPGIPDLDLTSVHFIDADAGYIIGTNDEGWFAYVTMLKTIDGGTTWNNNSHWVYGEVSYNSVFFTDANNGYIATGGSGELGSIGGILKTADGGMTWNNADISGYTGKLYSVYFPDALTGYAVGEYGSILSSTDGGTNWNIQSSGTDQNLNSVFFPDLNTGFVVGNNGTILRNIKGVITVGINKEEHPIRLNIYPNPATDKIILELPESVNSMNGIVYIYGINGQELISQQLNSSWLELNVNSLPTGTYFIRCVDGDKTGFGKFIKE